MVKHNQSVTVDGKEFTIAVEAKKKTVEEVFHRRLSTTIGILHLICAFLAISTGVNQYFVIRERYVFVDLGLFGTGIWTGIIFLAAGILNLKAGCRPHKCNVTAAMVLGILSTIAAVLLLTMAAFELVIVKEYENSQTLYDGYGYAPNCRECFRIKLITSVQIFVAIAEFVVGIVAAILSCKATCCKPESDVETQDIDMPDFLVKASTSMRSPKNIATAPAAANSLPDYWSTLPKPNSSYGKY